MAYMVYKLQDTIRVPPNKFKADLKKSVLEMVQGDYEGIVDEDLGVLIAAIAVESIGEGKVIPGDGGAWYDAVFSVLAFKPEIQEVLEGDVTEVTEFGAFINTGPIEGLVHVSQMMDDFINYDAKGPKFVGKETGRKVQVGDSVLSRVVTISLKGSISKSKIGLTMRQQGLGVHEWRLKQFAKKGREEKEAKDKKMERLKGESRAARK
ncbi:DNA-directed RNA polymerase [archaeon]|nr:DNA-directed RNA polymerase [archaeon]